ncbi:polysaccharide lyase 8 family protein [Streptacidiphilus fuscans]|uniref:Polysaccharide lyase 8 family protein n=1 Tax=Streptacidiphilus fuscans TaxID=2789292 RepID=A0A931FEW9_9ACTN|nr:polysaccharide lyase 8 family protein [Streptacidiphilus fuscans]MBF9069680.1 polysaccharide lyase 8 family protein [Streptacidiphilus fuscans]
MDQTTDETSLATTRRAPLTRRHLLGTGAAVTGAALLGAAAVAPAATAATPTSAPAGTPAPTPSPTTTPDPFDQLRGVWSDILTGGSAVDPSDPDYAAAIATVDAAAAADIALYDNSATPASVYTDMPFTHVENASGTYARLLATAVAWATPGSHYHQDPTVAARLVQALRLIGTAYYNPSSAEVGNWYHWEIAAPQDLVNTCAILGAQVPAADLASYLTTVAHFVPDPTHQQQGTVVTTGANRSDMCQITILRGILAKDASLVTLGRDKLSDIYPYVTTSDGYYQDGGYIQHGTVAYNGHYAYVLLNDLSQLSLLLTGSSWPITDPGFAVILDSVDLTYAPYMYDGLVMDVVRGRFLSRQGETDHDAGHDITEAVLRLIPVGSREQQKRWKALAKGWITRETFAPIKATASPARMALIKSILDDPLVRPAQQGPNHVQQPSVERAVHRREGWGWAVALSSSRITRLEAINGENQRGWHTGDGATYLYTGDNGHFTDNYWPTVDCTRLPGVTADTIPLPNSAGNGTLPPTTWAGGAVLDDRWGAVGLDLVAYGSPLRARKSWFCLDDCVVALGAGITGSSGHTVETTLENRNLHPTGTNRLTVDGTAQPTTLGWTAAFPATEGWAQLEGVGGYVLLPGGTSTGTVLRALREQRTGAWADIDNGPSTGGTTTPYTNTYVTLWLDHGVDPTDAQYAYVLLPGADARTTAQRAARPLVEVLANSADLQAIRDRQQDLTAANFFTAGSVAGLTTGGPASVLVQRRPAGLSVAVSDPTCTQSTLTVTVAGFGPIRSGFGEEPGVRVQVADGVATVTLDLTQGLPGTTRTARLRL